MSRLKVSIFTSHGVVILAKTVSRCVSDADQNLPCQPSTWQISIPPSQTVEVTRLLAKSPVQLAGLGARDSLRLEAGLCLHGNDIDENTSPVEAGLTWLIGAYLPSVICRLAHNLNMSCSLSLGKDRRETGNFIGAAHVLKHLKEGPPRRRVGLIVEGAPARRQSSFPPVISQRMC